MRNLVPEEEIFSYMQLLGYDLQLVLAKFKGSADDVVEQRTIGPKSLKLVSELEVHHLLFGY